MDDATSFGAWLRMHRKKLNLTQEDLANSLGMSPSVIQKIEGGTRQPSKYTMEVLAGYLGVSSKELSEELYVSAPNVLRTMDELHEHAMDLSDQAFIAKQQGKLQAAKQLYKQAFQFEEAAANLVEDNYSAEPTRSVLYRSAAAMAIDANELLEARRLIDIALSGRPPKEVEQELNELLDRIANTNMRD